jgi:hypothetical protein
MAAQATLAALNRLAAKLDEIDKTLKRILERQKPPRR